MRLFNTPESTGTQFLRKRFQDLANDFAAEKIRPIDRVIVFISSHGSNKNDDEEGFWIQCYDHERLHFEQTSLNFRTDILKVLKKVRCKKYLLIDACHSGAITDIEAEKMELDALVSCSPEQNSYEDPAWENGAFTEAILEAFYNEKVKIGKKRIEADSGSDNLLNLIELSDYVKLRVPSLVKKAKGDNQVPYLIRETSNEALPFFSNHKD